VALRRPRHSSLDDFDARGPADDERRCHANEKPGFNDPDNGRQPGLQSGWIGYLGKRAVGDVIAAVGRERLSAGHAELRRAADRRQPADRGLPSEGDDFDRERSARA